MAQYEFDVADALAEMAIAYARTLGNSDKLRLAGFLLGLANAVQQHATISQDAMRAAQEDTTLFDDVEADDPMEPGYHLQPGYHLHNMFENIAEDLEHLADVMDEQAAA